MSPRHHSTAEELDSRLHAGSTTRAIDEQASIEASLVCSHEAARTPLISPAADDVDSTLLTGSCASATPVIFRVRVSPNIFKARFFQPHDLYGRLEKRHRLLLLPHFTPKKKMPP